MFEEGSFRRRPRGFRRKCQSLKPYAAHPFVGGYDWHGAGAYDSSIMHAGGPAPPQYYTTYPSTPVVDNRAAYSWYKQPLSSPESLSSLTPNTQFDSTPPYPCHLAQNQQPTDLQQYQMDIFSSKFHSDYSFLSAIFLWSCLWQQKTIEIEENKANCHRKFTVQNSYKTSKWFFIECFIDNVSSMTSWWLLSNSPKIVTKITRERVSFRGKQVSHICDCSVCFIFDTSNDNFSMFDVFSNDNCYRIISSWLQINDQFVLMDWSQAIYRQSL